MKNLDLSDEVLSALQLQKEYIGLQLEEKIIRLLGITTLVLAFLIMGVTALYYWKGIISSIIFTVICLFIISCAAFYRKLVINRMKKDKVKAIHTSQVLLKNRLTSISAPTNSIIELYQTIRTITDIIHEIKKLFKEQQTN